MIQAELYSRTPQVTVTNVETNQSRVINSGETGQYTALLLPSGAYTVRVDAPGFKSFLQRNVTVAVNTDAEVDEAVAMDMWDPYVESVRAHVAESDRKIHSAIVTFVEEMAGIEIKEPADSVRNVLARA